MSSPVAACRVPRHAAALTLGLALASLLLSAGCADERQGADPTASKAPPPSVIAVAAEIKPIESQLDFVGRVVAINRVELRARVQGFLKERSFEEGQPVVAGDVLFQIEPDQYEAVVEQRKADVAKAVADAENADAQFRRGQELIKSNNIAKSRVDELKAAAAIAEAGIAQAQAALNAAELDLGYTRIVAPVAGRVGRASYTVGNLVGPNSGPLATIVSRDPIYVDFPLTQRQLLEARRDLQDKGHDPAGVVVKVRLPDASLYEHTGKINFVDVTTDPGTDSVTLRAQFPNPDGVLVDGQYVGVALQSGEPESAIVVPQSALQIDQQGVFVLIVDADNKAQVRRVEVGEIQGIVIRVTAGLKAGELVITQGVQKVRPGQVVSATPPPATPPPEAVQSADSASRTNRAAPAAAGDTGAAGK
jgi:membrane fusion protein (multidrug efflux system)